MELLDSSVSRNPARVTTLTAVYKVRDYRVRSTVTRDPYQNQSWAHVEVLTPALTWTQLVSMPTTDWWESAARHFLRNEFEQEEALLEEVATLLADRADHVLP